MTDRRNSRGFATRAVHAGQAPDPLTGAVMTPIYLSSTYAMERVGETKGYVYSRVGNPTRTPYEACVADLEGGGKAVSFASGLAAAAAILETLDAGAHVVAMEDLYGGVTRLLREVKPRSAGLRVDFADLAVPSTLARTLRPETRLVWVETPTNPQLKLVDLDEVGQTCRARGVISVVDNTFATPRLQRPLEHGIDLVVHSATKYLNGHSDVVGGMVVVGDNPALAERLRFMHYALGAIPSPFDSFLVLRGLKTLHLRVDRSCENAAAIAAWLARHPMVERVNYPGLASHPQHGLAKRQMAAFGGMVTFLPKGGLEAAKRITERCELFHLAVSLGGVESLIELPALMTHRTVPEEIRARVGVVDALIRLSCGVEDAEDLIADLDQAMR
jgi:cystathionine gamma-lyase